MEKPIYFYDTGARLMYMWVHCIIMKWKSVFFHVSMKTFSLYYLNKNFQSHLLFLICHRVFGSLLWQETTHPLQSFTAPSIVVMQTESMWHSRLGSHNQWLQALWWPLLIWHLYAHTYIIAHILFSTFLSLESYHIQVW